jgi:hypothetical protein
LHWMYFCIVWRAFSFEFPSRPFFSSFPPAQRNPKLGQAAGIGAPRELLFNFNFGLSEVSGFLGAGVCF